MVFIHNSGTETRTIRSAGTEAEGRSAVSLPASLQGVALRLARGICLCWDLGQINKWGYMDEKKDQQEIQKGSDIAVLLQSWGCNQGIGTWRMGRVEDLQLVYLVLWQAWLAIADRGKAMSWGG